MWMFLRYMPEGGYTYFITDFHEGAMKAVAKLPLDRPHEYLIFVG